METSTSRAPRRMNFTYRDARRLSSRVWQQDEVLNKKRSRGEGCVACAIHIGCEELSIFKIYVKCRWLVGPPITSVPDGSQKKLKRAKILTDMSLAESYVRSDDVCYETLRTNIEKSFGVFSDSQRSHHVVQDFQQFFETFNMERYSSDPSYFLQNFYSMLNALSINALCTVASLVADEKVVFGKTRPKIKKTIKEYLPKALKESSCNDCPTLIKRLSQNFENPSNFQKKQLNLRTPVSPSLLSSIHKALTELDEMPIQDLIAMNRKLKSISHARLMKFSPARFTGKREVLTERVKRKCQKVLLTLNIGDDLPTPFAKALSIVQLSLILKTRCLDIRTSEFYLYSPEIVGLQNDLLRAIWSLPKVRIHELKNLQPLVDPKAQFSAKTFRHTLRKYLKEYLFECDAIGIPEEILVVIASLNRKSRRRARLFTVEMIDEDVEATLSISSHLRRTVSNLLQEDEIDDKLEALESDDNSESNDFDLAEGGCCSYPEVFKQDACLKDEAECMAESNIASSLLHFSMIQPKLEPRELMHINTGQSDRPHRIEAFMAGGFIQKQEDDCINSSHQYNEQDPTIDDFIKKSNLEDHTEITVTHDFVEKSNPCPAHTRETMIQEICDETSLVAYRLIGHMLDKFIQVEGRDTNEMTRYYLRGGSSLDSRGVEDSLNTSEEATGTEVLFQSVQEMLPDFPKSCIEKMKKLMG